MVDKKFVVPPSGPNQLWQMDFSEFETRHGGVWRIGGVADYWSKLELGWHVATTQNHRDAIETVEQAIGETERLLGTVVEDVFVLHTGIAWTHLPAELGFDSEVTCWRRLDECGGGGTGCTRCS